MTRIHFAAALLALGSLSALPACSSSPSYRTSSYAPMPGSQELSPAMVRQVQTALQQQGMYNGAIDGIWGPQTASAVQSFQQSNALSPTGRLNSSTLAALNLPADDNTAPSQQSSATPPAATTNSPAANNATTQSDSSAPATTTPPNTTTTASHPTGSDDTAMP